MMKSPPIQSQCDIIEGTEQPIFIHIPKTGGHTVKAMFDKQIFSLGHRPAVSLRRGYPEPWEAAYANGRIFTIMRNPWDRVVSWYYYLKRNDFVTMRRQGKKVPEPGTVESKQWFDEHLGSPNALLHINNEHLSAQKLLCDADGKLLVPHVLRFERFDEEVQTIARRLGLSFQQVLHANRNKSKPDAFHYSTMYTPWSRSRVSEVFAWDWETFGYTFEDRS